MADVIALSPFCQLLQCTYRRSIGSSYSTGVERNIQKCHKLQDMSWNVTNLAVLNCPTNNLGDYKDPNIMIHQETFKNTNQRKFSKLILQFLLQLVDIDVQANPVTPKLNFNSDPHRKTIFVLRNWSQENYWNSENSVEFRIRNAHFNFSAFSLDWIFDSDGKYPFYLDDWQSN